MAEDREVRAWIETRDSLERNVFLNAGAGSGKTESLVRRILALIKSGRPVGSIVAITFTKEAARMFYSRIGGELEKALAECAPRKHELPKEAWGPGEYYLLTRAMEDLDQAFFGTIDSFCRRLLTEHPQEAGFRSDFAPMEKKQEQEAFCLERFTHLIRSREPQELWLRYEELRELGMGTGDFLALIRTIWGFGGFTAEAGEPPVKPEKDDTFMARAGRDLSVFSELLDRYFADPATAREPLAKTQLDRLLRIERMARFKDRTAVLRAVQALADFWDSLPDKYVKKALREKFTAEEREIITKSYGALKETAEKCGPLLEAFEREKYYKSAAFGRDFCRWARDEMERRGVVTFESSLAAAVDMLRRDAASGGELTRYIQSRYRYYLVDEYQDTNLLQSELFFRLAAQEPQGDRRAARLLPGALFLVGDDKQAIYRFRGGDVDNYRRVRRVFEESEGCEVLQLSCNFRSSAPLTRWFDEVFSSSVFFGDSFPLIEPSDSQRLFSRRPSGREGKRPDWAESQNERADAAAEPAADGVYLYEVVGNRPGRFGRSGLPGNEERQIVRLIRDLLGRQVFAYDHRTGRAGLRPVSYEDIMVMTAEKDRLSPYMEAFEKAGIPYSVAGSSRFAASGALPAMKRLLEAALSGGDRYLSCLCLMEPPFCLSEGELYRLQTEEEQAGAGGAGRGFAELSGFAEEIGGLNPPAMYRRAMELLAGKMDVDREADTLCYGLELLRAETAQGRVRNGGELVRFIQEELICGDHEYEMSREERTRGVKLLNLHKAKGLEAPVVILADAAAPAERKAQICRDFSGRKVYIKTIKKDYNELIRTAQFDALMEEEEGRLAEEQTRLRYVAATRAASVLLIPRLYENVGENGAAARGEEKAGRWEELIASSKRPIPFWPFREQGHAEEGKTSIPAPPAPSARPVLQAFSGSALRFCSSPSYDSINPSGVKMKTHCGKPLSHGNDHAEGGSRPPESEGSFSAAVGTAVHRLMQTLADRREERLGSDELTLIIRWILRSVGLSDSHGQSSHEQNGRDQNIHGESSRGGGDPEQMLLSIAERMGRGGYPQTASPEERRLFPWIPEEVPADLTAVLRAADEVYTELPFTLYLTAGDSWLRALADALEIDRRKGGFLNGVMDLVYRMGSQWFICDYKTNLRRDGLYGHYEGQLTLYREVLKKLFEPEREPQAYLYHIPCRTGAGEEG